jgi:branched-chain amino acid transport system permease protein
MRERWRVLSPWAFALAAGLIAVAIRGRYGSHVVAFGLLYAALATSWSCLRAAGLFSFGQAGFFGAGALMQAWLVSSGRISPWPSLFASAAAGALAAIPLIPGLRLPPSSFSLATLAYAVFLKGLAGNVPAFGMEGFLLPRTPGFDGPEVPLLMVLALLVLALGIGYQAFLGRPAGRAAAALRQSPETALSLGIDLVESRWRPLMLSAATTAAGGALYAHLVGSVETSVVFSPTFSIVPLVLGMLGGALHPLGGLVGTIALFPLDELLLRPALPQTHTLAYGLALCGLLLLRPEGLLGARTPRIPAPAALRRRPHEPCGLAVRDLTVRRNGTTVLRDVSFSIEPGQILRVLGPNGAGKTSLLLAIAGRIPVARGAILLGGTPSPRGPAARARRGVGRTFQAPSPFPEWTVRENVALASERGNGSGEVEELLRELDLSALSGRPAGQLSMGEGKRLDLARVLALEPALLLLDEPLAGLSPAAAERVSGAIERKRRAGAAVVWVEHGPAAGDLASRLLVLDGGQVLFLGSPRDWEATREARS